MIRVQPLVQCAAAEGVSVTASIKSVKKWDRELYIPLIDNYQIQAADSWVVPKICRCQLYGD